MKSVRVFVSSPGDVVAEREKVGEIFGRLQIEFSGVLKLEPYFWEHEPMSAHTDFQSQIEPPSKFDIFVCLLFSRLGTQLHPALHRKADGSRYASGTEYELMDALEAFRASGAPEVLIYKREGSPVIPAEPKELREMIAAQYDTLKAFFEKFTQRDGHYVVATNTYAGLEDFEMKFESGMRKMLEHSIPNGAVGERSAPKTWLDGSPFRGLHHFDFKHAAIFCGRTRAIDEALTALKQQAANGCAFVLIFGGSGVGKSSLVRAGLLPLLVKPGIIDGIRIWRRAIIRPSEGTEGDLFEALGTALVGDNALPEIAQHGISPAQLGRMLRDAPEGVGLMIQRELSQICQDVRQKEKLEKPPRALFVLAIDQLEELFTIESLCAVRETFLRTLNVLARSGCVWVVATLRSDFYQRCAESPVLGELVKKGAGQYCLLPPNEAQLGQMIRLPAFAAGLEFEHDRNTGENLDDLLRDAAVKNPSMLPLLEFALDELYKERDPTSGRLKLASYYGFGGVEGALGKRAEESFQSVGQRARESFGDVFLQLVTIGRGEGEPAVRQWARKADIETSPERRELIDRLISDRLLFADCTEQGVDVITISHEAMLASWPRLKKWVSDHRESLKIRAQVTADASRWKENDRNPDFLYKGLPLEKAKLALDANFLGKEEREFVEASLVNSAEQQFRASLASGEQLREISQRLRAVYPELRIKILRDSFEPESDVQTRRNAVTLLGEEKEPVLAPDLLRLALSDLEASVRRAAAMSLAQWDDPELYAALESQLKNPADTGPAVRALAGIRVAADRWVRAPVFENRFGQISGGLRRQILRRSWNLRFWEGLPALPFVALPAAIFAAISAGIYMTIPGAFNWGLTQATANPAMAAFHGAAGGVVWSGIICCGLATYRLVFGRDLIRGSFLKPVGALGAGALFGFLSSVVVVIFCIVTVYTVPSLELMGWVQEVHPRRVSLSREFFRDLFLTTRFGWAHLITGTGLGIAMGMMSNGLQASDKWKDFLQRQARLSSLRQARNVIWNIIKLAFPYSWPLLLVMGLFALIASFVPVRNPALPKATTVGIVQGLIGDCSTQAFGGYFGIVGAGLGIVILRYGMNVEGRKT